VGRGEETDYLLSLIREGKQLWYDSSIAVWHQGRSGPYTDATCAKARSYGMGMGRVLRKHDYPYARRGASCIRPRLRSAPGSAFGKSGEGEVSLVDFRGPRHGLAGTSGTRSIADPPVGTVVDFDERRASSVKQLATRLAQNPLVQNAAALYGVQLVRKVLPLIIVPYLARTLGASGWGVVAFTLSMAELIVLLIEFGFNLSATREVARARDSGEECGADSCREFLGAQVLLASSGRFVRDCSEPFHPAAARRAQTARGRFVLRGRAGIHPAVVLSGARTPAPRRGHRSLRANRRDWCAYFFSCVRLRTRGSPCFFKVLRPHSRLSPA
jgi:hypothetical protein